MEKESTNTNVNIDIYTLIRTLKYLEMDLKNKIKLNIEKSLLTIDDEYMNGYIEGYIASLEYCIKEIKDILKFIRRNLDKEILKILDGYDDER